MGVIFARRRAIGLTSASLFAVALVVAPSGAAGAGSARHSPYPLHQVIDAVHTNHRTPLSQLTDEQREAIGGHPGIGDKSGYARAKARAAAALAARAPAAPAAPASAPTAPTTQRNFQGVNDVTHAPSDSTSAIGTQRYVELVNDNVAIYDRTNNTPIATDTLNALAAAGTGPDVFDPQIIWDPSTNRFYYATDVVLDASNNFLSFGFSKTTTPNNATTDWCHYSLGYGADFPDYPKLGDLDSLIMIGVNVFTTGFVESDVNAITKPPAGTTCPTASALTASGAFDVRNKDGSHTTTPLPVNQIDGSGTGYVLGGKGFTGGNFVSVFTATASGGSLVLGAARPMSVTAFTVPAPAAQPGTARQLDTLDTRFTNAVSAIDPGRSSQVGIWTQHTIAGGGGSVVQWFEINPVPATPVPFQSGTQSAASTFLYNAAIAPDRRRNGANGSFGDSMVLQYSKSSSTAKISIVAVSKIGTAAVSGETLLKTSPDVIDDFSCRAANVCRWGDYAGASADPASDTTKAHGVVWGVNAFAQASSATFADWRTQNFAVAPK